MKVKELKDLLEEVLDSLEDYEDDQEIRLVSNTYFLGHANYFLGISGYDGGYLNLRDIRVDDDEDDDYES